MYGVVYNFSNHCPRGKLQTGVSRQRTGSQSHWKKKWYFASGEYKLLRHPFNFVRSSGKLLQRFSPIRESGSEIWWWVYNTCVSAPTSGGKTNNKESGIKGLRYQKKYITGCIPNYYMLCSLFFWFTLFLVSDKKHPVLNWKLSVSFWYMHELITLIAEHMKKVKCV